MASLSSSWNSVSAQLPTLSQLQVFGDEDDDCTHDEQLAEQMMALQNAQAVG